MLSISIFIGRLGEYNYFQCFRRDWKLSTNNKNKIYHGKFLFAIIRYIMFSEVLRELSPEIQFPRFLTYRKQSRIDPSKHVCVYPTHWFTNKRWQEFPLGSKFSYTLFDDWKVPKMSTYASIRLIFEISAFDDFVVPNKLL